MLAFGQTFFDNSQQFVDGLPTIVRETMLQLPGNTPKAGLVLDALYFHGVREGEYLKEAQINDLLGISRRLIYLALRTVFFPRRKDPNHSGRGRPAYEYRIPSKLQVVFELEKSGAIVTWNAAYSGTWRASSPQRNTDMALNISDGLYKEDLQSLKTYRLALHRELILAHQFRGLEISRGRVADRLGISERTSRNYDKILDTRIEAQYERIELKENDWKDAPQELGEKRPEWLEVTKRGTFETKTVPYVKFLAWQYLKQEYKVVKVRRLFNRYYPKPHWRGYLVPGQRYEIPDSSDIPY